MNVNPKIRFYASVIMFVLSIAGGVYSTAVLAKSSYEKTLMAISWGAITITAIDLMATTDVRKDNDDKN